MPLHSEFVDLKMFQVRHIYILSLAMSPIATYKFKLYVFF